MGARRLFSTRSDPCPSVQSVAALRRARRGPRPATRALRPATRMVARTLHPAAMPHLVLLGDSIFDNAAYVRGGPDVVTHLAGMLPAGCRATLRGVDGAIIADVPRQLARL